MTKKYIREKYGKRVYYISRSTLNNNYNIIKEHGEYVGDIKGVFGQNVEIYFFKNGCVTVGNAGFGYPLTNNIFIKIKGGK